MKGSPKESRRLLQVVLSFSPMWEWIAARDYPRELPLYLLFSGGPDSTALALVLMELCKLASSPPRWKLLRQAFRDSSIAESARPFFRHPRHAKLTLLHLNHAIRPSADEEAEWVNNFAKRYSLECIIEKVDVPAIARSQKRSLEDAGRRARYAMLQRYLEAETNALGFTAHTLDDHAESVLFNLVEQTGLGGLLGIAPALHRRILRPFLGVSKQELNDFLLARGQVFLTDESNLVPDRPRTFLRQEILPRLREINPRARENILATSRHLRDYEGLFSWALRTVTSIAIGEDIRLRQQLALPLMPGVEYRLLGIAQWKEEIQESMSVVLGPLLRVFRHDIVWREAAELARAIRLGERWLRQDPQARSGIQFHPPTSLLVLVRADEPASDIELAAGAKVDSLVANISLRMLSPDRRERVLSRLRKQERHVQMTRPPELIAPRQPVTYEALFSARAALPLRIRRWQRGDRIAITGGGSARLSDVFTDRKIPRLLRVHWPVVTDSRGDIHWLPGLIRGRLGRTRRSAKKALLLRWLVKP